MPTRPQDAPLPEPIARFGEVYERASAAEVEGHLPFRAALATCDRDGRVSCRYVLVKEWDAEGFAFYSNYESRKARELASVPRAALCWHWWSIDEQVRVEGTVERLPGERSDAYFAGRPRGSQIGAWASSQSRILDSREALEAAVREMEQRFEGVDEIPRPPGWGGYLLRPERIEFWRAGSYRLHDRFEYVRSPDGSGWTMNRLWP
jgi:pyridoxamine 5'-phosphate oxidase